MDHKEQRGDDIVDLALFDATDSPEGNSMRLTSPNDAVPHTTSATRVLRPCPAPVNFMT